MLSLGSGVGMTCAGAGSLPKPRNVLLLDRGGHPPALGVGSRHIGGSGLFEFWFRVLELEMRKGARVVEKKYRPQPLYKGGVYQASSA